MSTKLYRVGVNPDCPVHQITVGGQCFTRRSEKVSGYGSQTKRVEMPGSIVELDEQQLKAIEKSAEAKFVRSTTGKKAKSFVVTYDGRTKPLPRDVPVVDFLYIEPVEENPYVERQRPTLAEAAAAAETSKASKKSAKA